ncbi:MAG: c-type cytochrome domain-containing protein [Polyangiaceae bacterium]
MRRLVSIGMLGVASIALASGCGQPSNSGSGECVADLDPAACSPLYPPTFDNVYARTLAKTCALSGGSCHAAEGQAGGLSFESADAAYEHLTSGTKPRVIAGDAACSLIVERIEATDDRVMPPGSPLSDAERCAVEQWIENGAQR